MIEPPLPQDEDQRLAELRSLRILDTPQEERFDRITRIATCLFDVPIALISLIDANRQWFKSCQGLAVSETPRAISFCGHAIIGKDVLVVPDARLDPRFSDNPLVTGQPYIRFYAGCPLTGPQGRKLGTLCLVDRRPRQMTEADLKTMKDLAVWAQNELNAVELNQAFMISENLLKMIFVTVPDCLKLVAVDGRLLNMNPAGLAMIEADSLDQVVGQSVYPLVVPGDRPAFKKLTEDAFRGKSGRLEYEIVGLKGTRRWLETHVVPFRNGKDEITAALGVTRDVTERKRMEESLKKSERQLAEAQQLAGIGNWSWDIQTNVVIWSDELYRLCGLQPRELPLSYETFLSFVHPDDRERVNGIIEKILKDHQPFNYDLRVVWPDGTVRIQHARGEVIVNQAGSPIRMHGTAQDVTESQQAEETIQQLAYYDILTGLPNRNLLHDRLQQAILAGQRENRPVALMLMDLDRFKEVNDTLGHQKGDLLLQEVGRRLRNVVWEPDVVARLGGDEFAILLPRLAAAEHISIVANKILKALEAPFVLEGLSVDVGASIGIALSPEHGEDADLLFQRADVALYAAKEAGSGYAVYAAKQDRYSPRSLSLMGELRHAIEHGELVLHYQPKVDLKIGRVIGVEALVRWRHPQRGLIPPDQFIPLAERTGLIKPLTYWILKEVHRQCDEWHRAGLKLPISVNLSVRNLQDPQLPDQVAESLQIGDGAPGWLQLEITESIIMADPAHAMETLTRLNKIGVRLSIDDFGTGYSSLGYLKRLPVEEIKIDKSFVMDMGANEDDTVIVLSIINLAHNLGRKVIAEGVESQEIWDRLAAFGCDAAQGYYMCKPLPASELTRWLRESPWGLTRN